MNESLDPNTDAMKKTINDFLETTEKGENPKERLGRLKPDLSLIPQSVLVLEAMAMMQGASKYGPYNWRRTKVQARTYIAAAMRHLAAWLDGEELASDSQIHHLAHARASLGVVMDAQMCGMMVDDRPRTGNAGGLIEAYAARHDTEERFRHRKVGYVIHTSNEEEISAKIPDGAGGMTYLDDPKTPSYRELMEERIRNIHVSDDEGISTKIPPTFYISGPMRGIPNSNFPAFDVVRDLGRRLGYIIISPADMDRKAGVDEGSDLSEIDVRTFVKRDVDILLSLSPERGDGIALLPGWEKSTGALAELFVARWLGLKIVSSLTFEEFKYQSPAETLAKIARTVDYTEGKWA